MSPVAVNAGFGWTPILLVLLNAIGLSGLLVAFVRTRPAMRAVAQKREANLLTERAEEMASMRERIDALETQLKLASEELRIVRHDLANANTSLDLFIALIEANPERAADHAKRVKSQRDETKRQITEEKVALAKVRVSQIGPSQ